MVFVYYLITLYVSICLRKAQIHQSSAFVNIFPFLTISDITFCIDLCFIAALVFVFWHSNKEASH